MSRKIIRVFLPFLIFFTLELKADLQGDIDRAASMLSEFHISPSILRKAKGIVLMSEVKGGFIFSGKIGSGLVIARIGKNWSAPSALGMGGVGWGLQIGGKVTDFILILNTDEALQAFSNGGNVTLGGDLSIAAGPVGADAEVAVALPPAAIFSYGKSRGIFAGVSLEGVVIVERAEANSKFYGKALSPHEILSGKIARPKSAANLYKQLKF